MDFDCSVGDDVSVLRARYTLGACSLWLSQDFLDLRQAHRLAHQPLFLLSTLHLAAEWCAGTLNASSPVTPFENVPCLADHLLNRHLCSQHRNRFPFILLQPSDRVVMVASLLARC